MNSELESVFAVDPPAVILGELEVITVGGEDLPRAARLLEEEHYLGAARPVGRTLVQAVHHQGRWVALLVWGPAALKLVDRDADIGWTDSQRAERIGLIVQNRRFLVMAKTRMPNLASRALALAVTPTSISTAPSVPCLCAPSSSKASAMSCARCLIRGRTIGNSLVPPSFC